MVQRYLTSRDLKTARSASCAIALPTASTSCSWWSWAPGCSLCHHYAFPKSLRNDQVFPYFIANVMPIGAAGLLVSGVYAASMSCLTGGNQLRHHRPDQRLLQPVPFKHAESGRWQPEREEQRHHVWLARIATVVLGAIETVGALYVGRWATSTRSPTS